ncbi:MAG: hypothetical protein HN495_00605 [Chloroflexi bacterium]|nr:hypothetical protein [Chloroflexota bacterium]
MIDKQIRNLMAAQITTLPIRLFLFAAITALALVLVVQISDIPVISAQDQPDSISGIVTNRTDGGKLPADLEVLLMSIDLASNQIIEQETTTVDEDGIFGFSKLISGGGLSYRVVVNHGSYTPSVDMSTVENWQNVRMSIYDETKSLNDITIGSYVMMIPTIDARSRQVGVLTVINVDNRGDQVWVPDLTDPELTGLDLLRFNLPEGFIDLSIESELPTGNVLEIDTGFALTNPIPPGEFAILISYILEYEGDSFDFNLKLPYGSDQVRMLLPDDGGSIDADGFDGPEPVVVGDSVFNQYQGDTYAAGIELGVSFSDLPQPTILQAVSDFFGGRTYVIVIIWIVGMTFLAILGYAMYSTRKNSNPASEDDDELANRDDIIAEIAALDKEYEADNIDEDEYNHRRDELKQLAFELSDIADDPTDESEQLDKSDTDSDDNEDDTSNASDQNSDPEETKPEDSDK